MKQAFPHWDIYQYLWDNNVGYKIQHHYVYPGCLFLCLHPIILNLNPYLYLRWSCFSATRLVISSEVWHDEVGTSLCHGLPKLSDEGRRLSSPWDEHRWTARFFSLQMMIGMILWWCFGLPSGKHTKSYWTLPFIVSFPIKHGDFP